MTTAFLFLVLSLTCESAWAKDDTADPALPPVEATRCIACDVDAAASIESFTSVEWVSLREGKILTGEEEAPSGADSGSARARQMRADGFVPHPPDLVWLTLVGFERWPSFMPHITETSVSQVDGRRMWVRQQYRIALARLQHTTIYDLAPREGMLRWKLDLEAEHDITASEGQWQLVPVDDGEGTLVRYRARMDPGRSLPDFIEDMLMRRSIRGLIQNLRSEVARRSGKD